MGFLEKAGKVRSHVVYGRDDEIKLLNFQNRNGDIKPYQLRQLRDMVKNMATNKYLIEVFWSDDDEGYIAIAPDLPGCSAFGDTPTEAMQEMNDAISAWMQAWTAMGREPPEPASKPRPAMAA